MIFGDMYKTVTFAKNCKNMAAEVGLIQIFSASAVWTILFYWFLLCFVCFFLLYFEIFGIKNHIFREILWILFSPWIPWIFLFSLLRKTEVSTLELCFIRSFSFYVRHLFKHNGHLCRWVGVNWPVFIIHPLSPPACVR